MTELDGGGPNRIVIISKDLVYLHAGAAYFQAE